MECKNCGTPLYDGNIECIKCSTDNTPYLSEAGIEENSDAEAIKKRCTVFGVVAVVFALITDGVGITLAIMSGFSKPFLFSAIAMSLVTLIMSAVSVRSAVVLKKTYQLNGGAKVGYVMGLFALNFAAAALFLLLIALAYFFIF